MVTWGVQLSHFCNFSSVSKPLETVSWCNDDDNDDHNRHDESKSACDNNSNDDDNWNDSNSANDDNDYDDDNGEDICNGDDRYDDSDEDWQNDTVEDLESESRRVNEWEKWEQRYKLCFAFLVDF